MAILLSGKPIAQEILNDLKKRILPLKRKPGLGIILVGSDEASHLYVKLKKKAAEACGINIHVYLIDKESAEQEVLQTIKSLNQDEEIDGIIVQLPLPNKFRTSRIIQAIDANKDVDGFHPENLKLIKKGRPRIISGLAKGILLLLRSSKLPLRGKTAIIVSKSKVFSQPLEYLLKQEGIQAKAMMSKSKKLKSYTQQADIVVVAVGRAKFLTSSWIKKDALVVDVGINRTKSGAVVGDVSPNVKTKAAFLTPVPGGTGPLTVAMLLQNTYELAMQRKSR